MSRRSIAAYTAPGVTYPAFVSIHAVDDLVELTVRAPANDDGSCGQVAAMTLTPREFSQLLEKVLTFLENR